MASYLAPDAIPRALFDVLIDRDDLRQRKGVIDAVAALHRFSLAVATPGTLGVHRLLQRVVRDDATVDQPRSWHAALDALLRALPGDSDRPDRWPVYEALAPHVLALAAAAVDTDTQAERLIGCST